MNSLFSSFDPMSFMFPLLWVSLAAGVACVPSGFWVADNKLTLAVSESTKSLMNNLMSVFSGKVHISGVSALAGLMAFLLTNNVLGMLPYVFTPTSHLSVALSVGLPLWLGMFFLSWLNTPEYMCAHLLPQGTPGGLMNFMVLIELSSSLIRPLTLSIRLMANMTAGHLLFSLLASSAWEGGLLALVTILTLMAMLVLLESGVALVQSYVFTILSALYVSESDCESMI